MSVVACDSPRAVFDKASELVAQSRLIALSGGATAAAFFYVLASKPIDWASKRLFWCDERCVPPDDKDSNYGLARRLLLSSARVPEDQVHRFRGEDDPEKAAAAYEAELRRHAPQGLDLAILGIGPDGHTASLFPGVPALEEKERWTAVTRSPAGQSRLTLTFPYLNRAKTLAVLAVAKEKAEIIARALKDPAAGLPIQRLRQNPAPLWLIDRAAAERI